MLMANPSLCSYKVHDNNTYTFELSEGSRDAVKALADCIEKLQLDGKWYGKGHLRLLVDARIAVGLPIRYLFEVLSDYNRPYPNLEPPKLSLAYLRSPDTVILDVYHMLAELFEPPLTVQFFTDDARAKRWLSESN